MIDEIVPSVVSAVETFGDPACAFLYPEEEAFLARAVEKRRREFTTGRWCARSALSRLGMPASPILPGPRGAPQWPRGIIGSITHCPGYRAAVVARTEDISGIGIDAEPNAPLPEGVGNVIAQPEELVQLGDLTDRQPDICWDRLLFSAKESVYKTWFPLMKRWLSFDEASIRIDWISGALWAKVLVPPPLPVGGLHDGFTGRWLKRGDLIVTSVVVTPSRADSS